MNTKRETVKEELMSKPLTIFRPARLVNSKTGDMRLTMSPLLWTRDGVIVLDDLHVGASND